MPGFDRQGVEKVIRDIRLSGKRASVRAYQVESILHLLSCVSQNNNVLLNLDCGMGKTLICQVTAFLSCENILPKNSKVLFLIPFRALKDQHREMASWLPRRQVLTIDEAEAKKRRVYTGLRGYEDFYFRDRLHRGRYVFTTPVYFANRVNAFASDDLKRIRLCILDEIDLFLASDWDREEIRKLRLGYDRVLQLLVSNQTTFIGASASLFNDAAKTFLRRYFSITLFEPRSRGLARYMPFSKITAVPVEDQRVQYLDADIANYLGRVSSILQGELAAQGCFLSEDELWAVATKIANRKRRTKTVRVHGRKLVVTNRISSACRALLLLSNTRIKLFEDTLEAVDVTSVRGQVIHLIDPQSEKRKTPFRTPHARNIATGKQKALLQLFRENKDKKGIAFLRQIVAIDQLRGILAKASTQKVTWIHSKIGTLVHKRITDFRSDNEVSLLMTRDLGGRGLDFPEADYLVVYSPLRDVNSMYQEIGRIRSTRLTKKDVYILYYANTAEQVKAGLLLQGMLRLNSTKRHPVFEIAEESWRAVAPVSLGIGQAC